MTLASIETIFRNIVRTEVGAAIREYVEPRLQELHGQLARDSHRRAGVDPDVVFVRVEKAARMVDVRPSTIRDWLRRGYLNRYRSGRLTRVKVSELYEFLARDAGQAAAVDVDSYADRYLDKLLAGIPAPAAAPDNHRGRRGNGGK